MSARERPASRASWRISCFGELRGDERRDGVVLDGGLLAGAEGCYRGGAVVEVHAVGEVEEASGCAGSASIWVKSSSLAVEAALGVVALVVGVVQLFGVEDLEGDVVLGGEGEGGGEFGAGEGGGVGDDGEHVVAEGLVGGVGEVGGVGASGVGDHDAAEVAEGALKKSGFFGQVHDGCFYSRTFGRREESRCVVSELGAARGGVGA